ncbi:MAG: ABC transporter ATP-binding protein [Saccharothrix sp.]|nr:ABC transporter ATP-binding protein [Saccharothrix sp.]
MPVGKSRTDRPRHRAVHDFPESRLLPGQPHSAVGQDRDPPPRHLPGQRPRLRLLPGTGPVDEVLVRLGLEDYADRRAGTLSLGNKQRLGLAKALLHRPELLVLDEPANGLDPAGVVEVRQLLRALSEEHGTTVVLSSHVLSEVARLATRVGIIHNGLLRHELDRGALAAAARPRLRVTTRDPVAATTALRTAGFAPHDDGTDGCTLSDDRAVHEPDLVATVLVRAGCPPTGLAVEQDDLETVFLRLVGAA